MNELDLKNELNSYYRIKQLISALENAKKEQQEFIKVCHERNIDLKQDEVIDYNTKLNEAYQTAIKEKNKVLQYIELMSDYPTYKAVLYSRYICCENTYESAVTVSCGRRSVSRYQKYAIEILLKKLQNMENQTSLSEKQVI